MERFICSRNWNMSEIPSKDFTKQITFSIFSLTFGTVWNKMVWLGQLSVFTHKGTRTTGWCCCAQNVGWKLWLKTALTELASLSGLNFYVNQFLFFLQQIEFISFQAYVWYTFKNYFKPCLPLCAKTIALTTYCPKPFCHCH